MLAFLQTEQKNALQTVFTKVKAWEILNNAVRNHLHPRIANYCQVAQLLESRLIILTANGSIATELRFSQAELLSKFKRDPLLKRVSAIHCKVCPTLALVAGKTPQKKAKNMPPLSPETADIILTIAQSLADPELKKIMERIAQRRVQSND